MAEDASAPDWGGPRCLAALEFLWLQGGEEPDSYARSPSCSYASFFPSFFPQ